MTILYLDADPKKCVALYSDKVLKEVIKVSRDTLQVLLGRDSRTISKRPLTVWAKKSEQNVAWLISLFLEANLESRERYWYEYEGLTDEEAQASEKLAYSDLVNRLYTKMPKTDGELFTPPPVINVFWKHGEVPMSDLDEPTDELYEHYWKLYLNAFKEARWTTRKIPTKIALELEKAGITFSAKTIKRSGKEVNVCQCTTS